MNIALTTEDIERRNARFQKSGSSSRNINLSSSKPVVISTSQGLYSDDGSYKKQNVVGVCTDLEKDYLRQTGEPDRLLVRPATVLKKALSHVLTRFYKGEKDYMWFTSQMKALRQDLMVQGIECAFAVKVYEYHAKMCLQFVDYGEMQQCLTRLLYLYSLGTDHVNHGEFLSFLMLFDLMPSRSSMKSDLFRKLTVYEKTLPEVQLVLQFRKALQCKHGVSCFHIYNKEASAYQRIIMDDILVNLRNHALEVLLTAFRPTLDIYSALEFIGFSMSMKPGCLQMQTFFTDMPKELQSRKNSTENPMFAQVNGRLYLKERNVVLTMKENEQGKKVQYVDCAESLVGFRKWQQEHNENVASQQRENAISSTSSASSAIPNKNPTTSSTIKGHTTSLKQKNKNKNSNPSSNKRKRT